MNVGNYSEALEQQVAMERYLRRHSGTLIAGETGEHEEALLDIIRGCKSATPYFWNRDICDLVRRGANALPDFNLTRKLLPSSSGWFWFEAPLEWSPGIADTELTGRMTALQWEWIQLKRELAGLFVAFYRASHVRSAGVPSMSFAWDENQSWQASADEAFKGLKKDPQNRQTARQAVSYLASALLFINQTLLQLNAIPAERHARKRIEREGWQGEPLIRVIELRRREHIGDKQPVASVERDWQCQWVVRGHWRQQWYAKAQRNQPIWITPYVKGPEDKPLKPPRATVFAVVR